MYRRQPGSSRIPMFILLGIFAGIGFLLYQQLTAPAAPPPPPPTATFIPTLTNTPPPLIPPTLTPAPRVGRLSIPTAGVNTAIVEVYLDGVSWDVHYLGQNAGHLQGTAWLGESGNVVLAGHVEMADGSPGIFATLDQMNPGDLVILSRRDKIVPLRCHRSENGSAG